MARFLKGIHMVEKKLIITADGFGESTESNQAVLEGYNNGFLTQASICANSAYFENAICDILPDCPNLGISASLNIKNGASLSDCELLTNSTRKFNNTYLSICANLYNKQFMEQLENEYRQQIEKLCSRTKVSCLNTVDNIHSIPQIFNILCKLAKEYKINYIRTQYESVYFISKISKNVNIKFIHNLIKLTLFNQLSKINKSTTYINNLNTNDFILGIGYNKLMDSETILSGLDEIEEESVTEIVFYPQKKTDFIKNYHTKDFGLIQNKNLQDKILRMGFEFTNYMNLS